MSDAPPADVLSWENLIYLADFLQAAGERQVSLLGGEPTLHPEFNNFVLYLLERGFNVTVFTSGIMSSGTLGEAERLFGGVSPNRFSFVCNLNDPDKTRTSLAEKESVRRFLGHFGERVTPGFNIYRQDFELGFLFELINEFGLRRRLRLGIAHPIPGTKNRFIAPEGIDGIIQRLFSFAPLMERLRIQPGFDCGFPLCRFSDEQVAWLARHVERGGTFSCGIPLDIGPDLSVWSCFPLSAYQKRSLFEFNSFGEAIDHFRRLHNDIRVEAGGIYGECDTCDKREVNLCAGGCVGHSLARFIDEERLRVKEVYQ